MKTCIYINNLQYKIVFIHIIINLINYMMKNLKQQQQSQGALSGVRLVNSGCITNQRGTHDAKSGVRPNGVPQQNVLKNSQHIYGIKRQNSRSKQNRQPSQNPQNPQLHQQNSRYQQPHQQHSSNNLTGTLDSNQLYKQKSVGAHSYNQSEKGKVTTSDRKTVVLPSSNHAQTVQKMMTVQNAAIIANQKQYLQSLSEQANNKLSNENERGVVVSNYSHQSTPQENPRYDPKSTPQNPPRKDSFAQQQILQQKYSITSSNPAHTAKQFPSTNPPLLGKGNTLLTISQGQHIPPKPQNLKHSSTKQIHLQHVPQPLTSIENEQLSTTNKGQVSKKEVDKYIQKYQRKVNENSSTIQSDTIGVPMIIDQQQQNHSGSNQKIGHSASNSQMVVTQYEEFMKNQEKGPTAVSNQFVVTNEVKQRRDSDNISMSGRAAGIQLNTSGIRYVGNQVSNPAQIAYNLSSNLNSNNMANNNNNTNVSSKMSSQMGQIYPTNISIQSPNKQRPKSSIPSACGVMPNQNQYDLQQQQSYLKQPQLQKMPSNQNNLLIMQVRSNVQMVNHLSNLQQQQFQQLQIQQQKIQNQAQGTPSGGAASVQQQQYAQNQGVATLSNAVNCRVRKHKAVTNKQSTGALVTKQMTINNINKLPQPIGNTQNVVGGPIEKKMVSKTSSGHNVLMAQNQVLGNYENQTLQQQQQNVSQQAQQIFFEKRNRSRGAVQGSNGQYQVGLQSNLPGQTNGAAQNVNGAQSPNMSCTVSNVIKTSQLQQVLLQPSNKNNDQVVVDHSGESQITPQNDLNVMNLQKSHQNFSTMINMNMQGTNLTQEVKMQNTGNVVPNCAQNGSQQNVRYPNYSGLIDENQTEITKKQTQTFDKRHVGPQMNQMNEIKNNKENLSAKPNQKDIPRRIASDAHSQALNIQNQPLKGPHQAQIQNGNRQLHKAAVPQSSKNLNNTLNSLTNLKKPIELNLNDPQERRSQNHISRSQKHNSQKQNQLQNPPENIDVHLHPATNRLFKRTYRHYFRRRMNQMDRPLLIIKFQGVLGDFFKDVGISNRQDHVMSKAYLQSIGLNANLQKQPQNEGQQHYTSHLWVRIGASDGLKYLSKHFQIVILNRDTCYEDHGSAFQQVNCIQQYFLQSEITIDAIYTIQQQITQPQQSNKGPKNEKMTEKQLEQSEKIKMIEIQNQGDLWEDYNQIYLDFQLGNDPNRIRDKVLFINSLDLDLNLKHEEIKLDQKGYFLFDARSEPARPLTSGLPLSYELGEKDIDLSDKQEMFQFNRSKAKETNHREMPVTVLVPNPRSMFCQQISFASVAKTVMILCFLGQKKSKVPLREHSDTLNDIRYLQEFDVKVQKDQCLLQYNSSKQKIDPIHNYQTNFSNNVNQSEAIRLSQQNLNPTDVSHNITSLNFSKQTNQSNNPASMNTNSTSYDYDSKNRPRSSNSHGRIMGGNSQSQNSRLMTNYDEQMQIQDESCDNFQTIVIPLTDNLFNNLSWASSFDYVNSPTITRQILGLVPVRSNLVWRYFLSLLKKRSNIQQLRENRCMELKGLLDKLELLQKDEGKVKKQQQIQDIYDKLKKVQTNGNPLTTMMARNLKVFIKIYAEVKRKTKTELDSFKHAIAVDQKLAALEKQNLENRILVLGVQKPNQFFNTHQRVYEKVALQNMKDLVNQNQFQGTVYNHNSNGFLNQSSYLAQKQRTQFQFSSISSNEHNNSTHEPSQRSLIDQSQHKTSHKKSQQASRHQVITTNSGGSYGKKKQSHNGVLNNGVNTPGPHGSSNVNNFSSQNSTNYSRRKIASRGEIDKSLIHRNFDQALVNGNQLRFVRDDDNQMNNSGTMGCKDSTSKA